ncbi:hypothetical protein [Streptomyces acidicola]|uniref:hypothetical protein n=1 Tax=Streptomyces acidicola TaxID=2596892 RepID=UPI00342B7748
MGKHSRPGPPNQPSRAVPRVDADDPLAAYEKRRRPPLDVWRRHRPLHGGGGHFRPDEPRALEEWNGFSYPCGHRREARGGPAVGERTDVRRRVGGMMIGLVLV